MPRPEKLRRIACGLAGRGFKPIGRPAADLDAETLRLDELEALRLADVIGLYQEAAAEQMGVSRTTFSRILTRARSKVARTIVEQQLLLIGDGPVLETDSPELPCPVHGGGPRRGRGCRCRGPRGPRSRGAG